MNDQDWAMEKAHVLMNLHGQLRITENGRLRISEYAIRDIAQALREARDSVIEECAKVADSMQNDAFLYETRDKSNAPGTGDCPKNVYFASALIAKAIRALKSEEGK